MRTIAKLTLLIFLSFGLGGLGISMNVSAQGGTQRAPALNLAGTQLVGDWGGTMDHK